MASYFILEACVAYMIIIAYLNKTCNAVTCDIKKQVERVNKEGQDICCYHQECQEGHYFIPCERNGEPDTCVPCDDETVQPDTFNTRYFSGDEVLCMIPECDCPEGSVPTPGNTCHKTGIRDCMCDRNTGHYGDDYFKCQYRSCSKPGLELKTTGKCEPCDYGFEKTTADNSLCVAVERKGSRTSLPPFFPSQPTDKQTTRKENKNKKDTDNISDSGNNMAEVPEKDLEEKYREKVNITTEDVESNLKNEITRIAVVIGVVIVLLVVGGIVSYCCWRKVLNGCSYTEIPQDNVELAENRSTEQNVYTRVCMEQNGDARGHILENDNSRGEVRQNEGRSPMPQNGGIRNASSQQNDGTRGVSLQNGGIRGASLQQNGGIRGASLQQNGGIGGASLQQNDVIRGASLQNGGIRGASLQQNDVIRGASLQNGGIRGAFLQQNGGIGGASLQHNNVNRGASLQNGGIRGASLQQNGGIGGASLQQNDVIRVASLQNGGIRGASLQQNDGIRGNSLQQNDGDMSASLQQISGSSSASLQKYDDIRNHINDGSIKGQVQQNDPRISKQSNEGGSTTLHQNEGANLDVPLENSFCPDQQGLKSGPKGEKDYNAIDINIGSLENELHDNATSQSGFVGTRNESREEKLVPMAMVLPFLVVKDKRDEVITVQPDNNDSNPRMVLNDGTSFSYNANLPETESILPLGHSFPALQSGDQSSSITSYMRVSAEPLEYPSSAPEDDIDDGENTNVKSSVEEQEIDDEKTNVDTSVKEHIEPDENELEAKEEINQSQIDEDRFFSQRSNLALAHSFSDLPSLAFNRLSASTAEDDIDDGENTNVKSSVEEQEIDDEKTNVDTSVKEHIEPDENELEAKEEINQSQIDEDRFFSQRSNLALAHSFSDLPSLAFNRLSASTAEDGTQTQRKNIRRSNSFS